MRARLILGAMLAASMLAPTAPAAALTLVYPDQSTPDSASISPITAAFVAAVGPFDGFLEASDELAAARAEGRLRDFALREAPARAAIIVELQAWADGIARERDAEAHAPTLDRLGPLFGSVQDPANIVIVPADLRQRDDFKALERLDGPAFDALFTSSQAATLRQLETHYIDYIKNGDDQVLRALSVRDLKRVRGLLAALPRG